MAILNPEAAIESAKQLTTTSIEHDLITASEDPVKTANDVYTFYKTLFEKLSGKTAE